MATVSVATQPSFRWLGIASWVAQIALAVVFGSAGLMKLTQTVPALAESLTWVGSVPPALVRFNGLAEILGAVGLILPAATRIKPGLTPLAAAGLIVVMLLASMLNISRGEAEAVPVNLVLGALAAFVVWARSTHARIDAR